MTQQRRAYPWTQHEADLWRWVCFEACKNAAYGPADGPVTISADELSRQPARPVSLRQCSRRCLAKGLERLCGQGLIKAVGRGATYEVAVTPAGTQAAWLLLGAFHEQWDVLWVLDRLELQESATWPDVQAVAALAAARDGGEQSPDHHGSGPRPDPRPWLERAARNGWLVRQGHLYALHPSAREAVMLFRLTTMNMVRQAHDLAKMAPLRRPAGDRG